MIPDHIRKRETPFGQWLPLILYSINFAAWLITGILFDARELLWLAVLPLPALVIYWGRTHERAA